MRNRSLKLSDIHSIIGTSVCSRGANMYGAPCRYTLFSPSDSPWSEKYSMAVSASCAAAIARKPSMVLLRK